LTERQALLIREVDHRAKNSLQLAASMLLLQARRQPMNPAAPDLERAVERLQVLAEIHRASYQAEALDQIAMRDWIANLCQGLLFQPGVVLRVDCPEVCWPFTVAAPAGLFIGEALANACKHAFSDSGGRVVVKVEPLDAGLFRLCVADDGKGVPSPAPSGLGSQLLSAFANQLGGQLKRGAGLDGRGLAVSVDFSAPAGG
jgi:two-component sensor histidine kinase